MTYLNVQEVETAVVNLSTAYPSLTQLITLPHTTFEGRTSHALRIGGGSAGSRDVVMAIGGQHAREWGSCEILINFAADLLEAYDTNMGLVYGGKSFTSAQVNGIVEGLHVVVMPLVNPDGRNYSQTVDADWRRNRNPANSGDIPACIGIDLNRNYDFLFDFRNKLDPDSYASGDVSVSDDPCDPGQRYHGPSAFSEPETQNVRWLIDAFPRVRWFFDVHSYSQLILHNWGDDENQSTDPDMNFRNPAYDLTRGVEFDTAYKEYIPEGDALIEAQMGQRMNAALTAVRDTTYTVGPSFSTLYGVSGSSKDYAYSRHLSDPSKPKTFAYTIEWGLAFQPAWPEMELIIQDVSAALVEVCVQAPCAAGQVAVSLDTPSLQFIDVPAGQEAVRAAVFTVQSCSAVTFSAQTPVETPPGPATFGLPMGSVESLPSAPSAAPRQVRVWVSYQATSPNDVATASVTIHCDPIDRDFVIPITANSIAPPRTASVLALDKSESMLWDSGIPGKARIDVLHDAAPVYVGLLPDNHGIGIVAFDHDPSPVMGVTGVDAGGRGQANMHITDHQPNPSGATAIGDGVEAAHDALDDVSGYDHEAIVVFTDGHETASQYIHDVETLIDERVFALGLGTAQQLDPVALNKLVNEREGYLLLTGDLRGDDELRVEKYFSQIQAGVSNEEVVVDPEGRLRPGDVHRIPYTVTESDQSASVFLLSPAPWAIDFELETPAGEVIDPSAASTTPAIDFVTATRVHQYRMTFPVGIGADAAQGLWHARLSVTRDGFKKYLSEDRQRSSSAVHGIPYSLNVHAVSNLRMNAVVDQSSYEPGAAVVLRATLTELGLPVQNRAHVRADVTRPDGSQESLSLNEMGPGLFEAHTVAGAPGVYPIRFRAVGDSLRGYPFSREQLRTAAVWRGGDDEPPSTGTGPSGEGLDYCRLIECLLRQESVRAWLERQKIDVDELRKCLEAVCAEPGETARLLDLPANRLLRDRPPG